MSNTIQVKRGANASLPTLNAGEFGFSTDTYQVYIGDGVDNHELTLVSKLTTTSGDLQSSIDKKIELDENNNLTVSGNVETTGSGLGIFPNGVRIQNTYTPTSSSGTGSKGSVCWDNNYIYICIARDTWKRTSISTWGGSNFYF